MNSALMKGTTKAFGGYLTTLKKEVKRLKDSERRVKAVHRIRVTTRRLPTLFQMFPETSDGKTARRFRKELKRLRRLLGKVRETDVHQQLWKDLGKGHPCFRGISREIELRQTEAFGRFEKKWDRKRFNTFLK